MSLGRKANLNTAARVKISINKIVSLSGTGMGIFRKFANVIEAKTIEVLFNTYALTDVGCAYKLFKKESLKKISPLWRINQSPLFNTELILLTVSEKFKFVEIPITYNKRIGNSSIVGKWYLVLMWALAIQLYIFFFWLRWLLKRVKSVE